MVEPPGGVALFPWLLCFLGLLPPLRFDGLTCCATWAFALRFALPTFTSSCLCLSAFVLVASSADRSFCNDTRWDFTGIATIVITRYQYDWETLQILISEREKERDFIYIYLIDLSTLYYYLICTICNVVHTHREIVLNIDAYLYIYLELLLEQRSLFKDVLLKEFFMPE